MIFHGKKLLVLSKESHGLSTKRSYVVFTKQLILGNSQIGLVYSTIFTIEAPDFKRTYSNLPHKFCPLVLKFRNFQYQISTLRFDF